MILESRKPLLLPARTFLSLAMTVMTVTAYKVAEYNRTPSHPLGSMRHACDRVCVDGEPPMTCKFQFVVEVYSALGRVRTQHVEFI